ncbi:MAG: hypothetical protein KBS79_01745 [Lachnospiraceae bacterium]|nr:hypothetical protein [Candidatus Minthocola equi]
MKKVISVLFAVLMLMMAACGSEETPTTGAPSPTNAPTQDAYYFEYKGTKIAMNAEAAPIVAALGEPTNYFESASCVFNGLDKEYTYADFVLKTYPKDDVDYVSAIVIMSDLAETPEKICIGADVEAVKAAYGAPASETDTLLSYTKGDSEVQFITLMGKVVSIQYFAKTDVQ